MKRVLWRTSAWLLIVMGLVVTLGSLMVALGALQAVGPEDYTPPHLCGSSPRRYWCDHRRLRFSNQAPEGRVGRLVLASALLPYEKSHREGSRARN
jgi:hypothetical protein